MKTIFKLPDSLRSGASVKSGDVSESYTSRSNKTRARTAEELCCFSYDTKRNSANAFYVVIPLISLTGDTYLIAVLSLCMLYN